MSPFHIVGNWTMGMAMMFATISMDYGIVFVAVAIFCVLVAMYNYFLEIKNA